MFDFFSMANNYNKRRVDHFEKGKLVVDTCSVNDGEHPYETGVSHPKYNDGDWVIVEGYDTKKDAQKGHNAWVKKMTAKILPASLKDCLNSGIAKLSNLVGCENEFPQN